MQMRIFIAAMVAAFGIGSYAAAVLVWDRRRRLRLGTGAGLAWSAGLFVFGTALVAGSCVGLISF